MTTRSEAIAPNQISGIRPLPSGTADRSQPAIVVDLFRILSGLLITGYFAWLLATAGVFTSRDGLLDHDLSFRLFWFTRYGLLQPGVPSSLPLAFLWICLLLSVLIVIGFKPRFAAAVSFVLCVSIQRWNFLVYYVDDMAVQLLLFWLILLPIGHTLTIVSFFTGYRKGFTSEVRARVPVHTTRLFLFNICLIYVVSGITKLTSPMWRDGQALYAVLRLPISQMHAWWTYGSLPALKALNYIALATELAIPVLLASTRLTYKTVGLVLQLAMHIGILITIGIPFANLALPAASVLFFRDQIASACFKNRSDSYELIRPLSRWTDKLGMYYVVVLLISCLHKIQILRPVVITAFAALWSIGVTQNYHLFNWIDDRRYTRTIEMRLSHSGKMSKTNGEALLPDNTRAVLLEMNLYGMEWLPGIDETLSDELKCSILKRAAGRYCGTETRAVDVEVAAKIAPIRTEYPEDTGEYRIDLMRFSCAKGLMTAFEPQLTLQSIGRSQQCRFGRDPQ